MAKYILSPTAQISLREIRKYSIRKFGLERTQSYLTDIKKRMNELALNPSRGLIRKELKVGYYSDFIGSHTIYYRISPPNIDIIDILHQSMESSRHISS